MERLACSGTRLNHVVVAAFHPVVEFNGATKVLVTGFFNNLITTPPVLVFPWP